MFLDKFRNRYSFHLLSYRGYIIYHLNKGLNYLDSIGIINNEYLEYLLEDENDEFLNSVKKSFLENESIKKRIFYYKELDTKVAYMLYYNGVDFTDLIKKNLKVL